MAKQINTASIGTALILWLAAGAQARVVGWLAAITDFPQVPRAVAEDVARRGCRIPQVEGARELHNVVQGQFERRGQHDWAVLCLVGNTSTIFVYWNGSAKNPARLAPRDETITPSKNGYYRILQAVDGKFIREHYFPGFSDEPPRVIDHDGIDDGVDGKGSSVHYLDHHRWLELAGSD